VIAVTILPIAFLLMYAAQRLLVVLRERLDSSPTTLGAGGFLDALAALALGAGLSSFLVGLTATTLGAGAIPVVAGLGMLLVLVYAAGAVLNPPSLGLTVRDRAAAGLEALEAVAALVKLVFLRVVPVAYATASIVAMSALIWLLFLFFGTNPPPDWAVVWICGRVLTVSLIPAAAWLGFHLMWLALEVVRSLISGRGGTMIEIDAD
jgi:hypothetical protein